MSFLSVSDLIVKNKEFFESQSKDELIENLMVMIQHVKDQASTNQSSSSNTSVPAVTGKKRSISEVQSAPVDVSGTVEKLRIILQKQIKSQLKWKTSCKQGKAQWKYQGLCGSDEIFKTLMGCDTKFKKKKLSLDDFYKVVGTDYISANIRYDTLTLCGDVNVSWNADTKEFGFSGKYGK